MHHLQVENYYPAELLRTQACDTASQTTLRICCERVREGLGYVGGFYSKNQVVKGKRLLLGTALAVQGLRLSALKAEGTCLIPGQ